MTMPFDPAAPFQVPHPWTGLRTATSHSGRWWKGLWLDPAISLHESSPQTAALPSAAFACSLPPLNSQTQKDFPCRKQLAQPWISDAAIGNSPRARNTFPAPPREVLSGTLDSHILNQNPIQTKIGFKRIKYSFYCHKIGRILLAPK